MLLLIGAMDQLFSIANPQEYRLCNRTSGNLEFGGLSHMDHRQADFTLVFHNDVERKIKSQWVHVTSSLVVAILEKIDRKERL